jgi:tRNA pseudouridine55 synthase
LDPLATGVLLLCLGKATRVAEYLMDSSKRYLANVRLGITTDTYDAEGAIVAEALVVATREQVEAALAPFRGRIMQQPPMYSAIKHNGVALHRLARQGLTVPRRPRPVHVFQLELCNWEPPDLTIEVTCSRGTYVRTLVHDMGLALGCGAHLAGLTRTASGEFRLEDAVTLEELSLAASEGRWQEHLQPLDIALSGFPTVRLDQDAARRICLGQAVPAPATDDGLALPGRRGTQKHTIPVPGQANHDGGGKASAGDAALACARGPHGRLLAVVAVDRAANLLRPRKVFCSPQA